MSDVVNVAARLAEFARSRPHAIAIAAAVAERNSMPTAIGSPPDCVPGACRMVLG